MPEENSASRQFFTSRMGLLLSVLGIAVGTGNIWRFPRIAAQNGGEAGAAAFIVAWIGFLFIWSIPLIIAEYAIGREGRLGTIGSFIRVAGKKYAWMGAFIALVATAIMFYYSVVAGWCIYYFGLMVSGNLPQTTDAAMATWDGFQDGGLPVFFHAVAMGAGAMICLKGISSIEKANKILVPTLLLVVLISVGRAITLPGAGEGIAYLFTIEWSQLTKPGIWLEALTQNAWDTGAGWGLILTYAAYMRRGHGVVKNAFITGISNNAVSLLAAIMVFGIVFATLGAEMSRPEILEIMRNSGPASTGLTFIWMPQLFARMSFGTPLAVLFFLGLTFAAFSSLISMIELSTRIFVDMGFQRRVVIPSIAAGGFLLGLPSAIHLGFLGNQDFVWGVALMISGAFVAFAIRAHGVSKLAHQISIGAERDWRVGRIWKVIISVLVPVQAIVLLVWWMYLSATEISPDRWFDPLDPASVMTCVVQWGVAAVLLFLMNKGMVRAVVRNW